MLLNWWKRRRRETVRGEPVPETWSGILDQNVGMFARLTPEEQRKLLADMQVFIAEKHWEGCRGIEITEEIRVTVAAQACLLVLGFEEEYFDQVRTVLISPRDYARKGLTVTDRGLVIEGEYQYSGEAWSRGPVVLSWEDVLDGGRNETDGENLVLHEFAHQLDMQNGRVADGIPPLPTEERLHAWLEVFDAEYERHRIDCRRGRYTLLDPYGAEDPSEFFAVTTECFFERPRALAVRHPRLYEQFRDFYRQDPALRFS
jgi:MtfA peptidase